jgi:hypothetical protein
MKIAVALAVVLLVLAGEARADCLVPMRGVVEASFEVQSCRIANAPRPDKRRLARIRVASMSVRTVPDSADALEVVSSYATFVASLSTARTVYVEVVSKDACASFPEGREVVASVAVMCCDTIPHRGLCALPGPIVRPN